MMLPCDLEVIFPMSLSLEKMVAINLYFWNRLYELYPHINTSDFLFPVRTECFVYLRAAI